MASHSQRCCSIYDVHIRISIGAMLNVRCHSHLYLACIRVSIRMFITFITHSSSIQEKKRKKNTKLRIFYGANKRNDAGTMSYIQRYMITSHQRIKAVVDGGGAHIITMYIVMMVSFCAVFQLNTNKKQN